MDRATSFGRASIGAIYLALSLGLIVLAILPLDRLAGQLAGPDLLLAITLVWVIRSPNSVPIALIAFVFLLADLFWSRPPGLMAAAVVVGTEFLRRRTDLTTEVAFVAEWGVASAIASAIVIGQASVLSLLGVPAPALGMLLIKLIGTILIYPVLAGAARMLFGLRRRGAQGDLGFGERR